MGMLDGRRAVVTGAASGMGAAICRQFAEEGAQVVGLDVNEVTDAPFEHCDVSSWVAVERAFTAAAERMGGLDIVVNNAGIGTASKIHKTPLEVWQQLIDINLTGVFHGIRAGVPLLRAAGGGAILNTASISGVRPAAGEAGYAASKAGVSALTAVAALEYAPQIRVNAIAPGTVVSALTAPLMAWDVTKEHQLAKIPLARFGQPEDIANLATFLCSDKASFITGQTIVADGGNILHGSGVDGLLDLLAAQGLEVD